jgi:predicted permease
MSIFIVGWCGLAFLFGLLIQSLAHKETWRGELLRVAGYIIMLVSMGFFLAEINDKWELIAPKQVNTFALD